jgi:hypothetical protein
MALDCNILACLIMPLLLIINNISSFGSFLVIVFVFLFISYIIMFAFTSPGMNVDDHSNKGRGPPTLRIQGQVCHRIGSMLPPEGEPPKFAQLYIYDTENEVRNRMHNFRSAIV